VTGKTAMAELYRRTLTDKFVDRINDDQIATLLDAGADYIDAHGWTQRSLACDGKVCARGGMFYALVEARKDLGERVAGIDSGIILAAESALSKHVGCASIPHWNDTPGRSQEEVTQAMRDCALKLRPDETGGMA
jgi:hypothetical protein